MQITEKKENKNFSDHDLVNICKTRRAYECNAMKDQLFSFH